MKPAAVPTRIFAADAAKAQKRASEAHPAVVVADVAQGSGNGWMVLRDLRRDPRTHDIPVVAVTADAAPSVRARAQREGCAALCLKSCPADALAYGLRAVLERQREADRMGETMSTRVTR